MLSHKVTDLRVFLSNFLYGLVSSPGLVSSLLRSSSLSWVSPMFGRVTSLLVANGAFPVLNMFCLFARREIDSIHIHGKEVPWRWSVVDLLGDWKGPFSPSP